jgi:hypothetical protein
MLTVLRAENAQEKPIPVWEAPRVCYDHTSKAWLEMYLAHDLSYACSTCATRWNPVRLTVLRADAPSIRDWN